MNIAVDEKTNAPKEFSASLKPNSLPCTSLSPSSLTVLIVAGQYVKIVVNDQITLMIIIAV
jgi:hypothetical protein